MTASTTRTQGVQPCCWRPVCGSSAIWIKRHLGKVATGDRVEVRLSAYQDRIFKGIIERVRPLVNFALGGPETNRPIRPLGTGAPEWPATFAVRVQLVAQRHTDRPRADRLCDRRARKRQPLAVPRGTVSAVSGNRGIAFVVGIRSDNRSSREMSSRESRITSGSRSATA